MLYPILVICVKESDTKIRAGLAKPFWSEGHHTERHKPLDRASGVDDYAPFDKVCLIHLPPKLLMYSSSLPFLVIYSCHRSVPCVLLSLILMLPFPPLGALSVPFIDPRVAGAYSLPMLVAFMLLAGKMENSG